MADAGDAQCSRKHKTVVVEIFPYLGVGREAVEPVREALALQEGVNGE